MQQLPLLSVGPDMAATGADRGPLDPDSERLLDTYRAARLAEGAARSVTREVSQLRAVAREAGHTDEPAALRMLFADLALVAQVLREPKAAIARSTGRARSSPSSDSSGRRVGSSVAIRIDDLAALDLPPARRSTGLAHHRHAGSRHGRPTPARGPTLGAADLRRIVDAAGDAANGHQVQRDRTLAALHCFSGLRPEEIVGLRWEDLRTDLTAIGRYGMTAALDPRRAADTAPPAGAGRRGDRGP